VKTAQLKRLKPAKKKVWAGNKTVFLLLLVKASQKKQASGCANINLARLFNLVVPRKQRFASGYVFEACSNSSKQGSPIQPL